MKKIITKLIGVTLGLAMAIGVGVGVAANNRKATGLNAAETLAHTLSGSESTGGNSSPHNSYTAAATSTQDGVSWSVMGNSNMTPWRIGGKGMASPFTRAITSTTTVSAYNITKVIVTTSIPGSNSLTPTNVQLNVGTSSGGTQTSELSNDGWTTSVTFERPNNKDWSGKYFEIVFTFPANSTTTNKYTNFISASFYYDASVPITAISVSPSEVELAPGDTQVITPTFTPASGYTDTVSWWSDDASVATVSSGTITAVADGVCNVYCYVDANSNGQWDNGEVNGAVDVYVETPTEPYINLTLNSGAASFTGQTVSISATYGNGVAGLNWSIISGAITGEASASNSGYSAVIGGNTDSTLTIRATDTGSALYQQVSVNVTKVTLTLNKNSTSIGRGESETLTATHNADAVDGVEWTSNNVKVTVENGVVSVASDATPDSTAVITATSLVDSTVSATCTVTVVRDQRWNTDFPNTMVSEIVLPASGDTADKYYVTAKITAITSVTNGHGNAVDEQGTSFAIYYMYSYDGSVKYGDMASELKPVVGDIVVLCGVFTKYNNGPEMKNARLVQRNGDVAFVQHGVINLGIEDKIVSASADLLSWEVPGKFTMTNEKNGGTDANNYYPGKSNTSTRFYNKNRLTITPASGMVATKAIFVATSVSYATTFAGSNFTNATSSATDAVVTVTFEDGTQPVVVVVGGTCGFTFVEVFYDQSIEQSVETDYSTRSSLYYRYHKTDGGAFTYSDVAIRFGALFSKEFWNILNANSEIQGYGVLVSSVDHTSTNKLKTYYAYASTDDEVDDFYKPKAQKAVPTLATDEQKGTLEGEQYIWNVFYKISSEDLTKPLVAVAYIKVNGTIAFMNETRTSAAKIAYDLINSGTDAGSAEGSLQNLANQYSA